MGGNPLSKSWSIFPHFAMYVLRPATHSKSTPPPQGAFLRPLAVLTARQPQESGVARRGRLSWL
jgi:hypothetical protein